LNDIAAGKKVNKKSYLMAASGLVLIVTGGAYAYTWTTSELSIGISEPTGDIATVNATATQPDWDEVLVPVTDTIIYRPDAAGDETDIADQFPAAGDHWDKVDEAISDNDTSYLSTEDRNWQEDLYHIPDHSTKTAGGDINHAQVYMVSRVEEAGNPAAYVHIKTNGAEYNGTSENLTTSYATYSYQWNSNPQTSASWTWNGIDTLQIGIGLTRPKRNRYARSTQNYVEIEFEAPPLTGNTPTGDLFEVSEHPDYSGELTVIVYLTNTDALQKAFNNLSLELYLEDSEEAGQSPTHKTLTLGNGVATFTLKDPVSNNHTLSVTGGNYTLTSREVSEWAAGYTVTPELYCEVIQR
jgi:hypothetical protein